MIPMKCPQCSARGEIPIDKLGMRLHCRKCGTHFHMDATGGVHLGDPNDASRKPRKAETRPTEPIDLNPLGWIKGLSVRTRAGLGLILAVALIGAGVSAAGRAFGNSGTLEGRAARLGELFLDMQLDAMKPFATPESAGALTPWYDTTRSKFLLDKPRASAAEASAFTMIKTQTDADAETLTTVTMADDPNKPGHTFSFPLVWKHDGGTWLVDFKASEKAYHTSVRQSIESRRREEMRQKGRGGRR